MQGARQWSPKFGETAAALVALSATQRVLECMLSKLCTKERSGDTECLWAAKALGSYVRATPQQVEPATPEMYAVSRGLLLLLGHKNVLVRRAAARYRPPPPASPPLPAAARYRPPLAHHRPQPPATARH